MPWCSLQIARDHLFLAVFFRVAHDGLSERDTTDSVSDHTPKVPDELLLDHSKRFGQENSYSSTDDLCSSKYLPNHHCVVENAFREQVNSGFSPSP